MWKFAPFFIACVVAFPGLAAAQLSATERSELFAHIDQMCRDASTTGEVISYEGDLSAGAILRVVGVEATGRIKSEQWENLVQKFGEFRSDPTICRFDMFTLIVPLFEGVSDADYQRIADTCQRSGSFRFCVKTQNINRYGNTIMVPITIEAIDGSGIDFQFGDGGGALYTDTEGEYKREKYGGTIRTDGSAPFSNVFAATLDDDPSPSKLAVRIALVRPTMEVLFDNIFLR